VRREKLEKKKIRSSITQVVLLSCQQVDGIVVYENRLFSFQPDPVTLEPTNDARSLWQIVKLRNLEPVEHKTLICATTKVTRMVEIKKKLLSTLEALSEGNTSETIVFARDSQFEDQIVTVVETAFDLEIRTLRSIFTKDLVEETKKKYNNAVDLDEQGVLMGAQICTQHLTLLERIIRREEQQGDDNQLYFV
jgi:hypothetical protein